MSTPATPPTPPTPAGAGQDTAPADALTRVLSIIDLGLKSAGALTGGPLGAGLNLADALLKIGAHARAVYEAETGTPYDLSKVPLEDHV